MGRKRNGADAYLEDYSRFRLVRVLTVLGKGWSEPNGSVGQIYSNTHVSECCGKVEMPTGNAVETGKRLEARRKVSRLI